MSAIDINPTQDTTRTELANEVCLLSIRGPLSIHNIVVLVDVETELLSTLALIRGSMH